MITILIVGVAIGFNFIILKYKYDKGRHLDLVLDLIVLVTLSYLFGGTILGMASAMVGGALVSLYLLFTTKPPEETPSSNSSTRQSNVVW